MDMSSYNRKYATIESLLTATGNLNAALTRREWFTKLAIYKKIIKDSSDLDIFQDVSFADRVFFLLNKTPLQKCPACGKPYITFEKSQHVYSLCSHKKNLDREKNKKDRATRYAKVTKEFDQSLLKDSLNFSDTEEFKKLVNEYFDKPVNETFCISAKNADFLHDVIIKTQSLLPYKFDGNYEFSQRIYILKNYLSSLPTCAFCSAHTAFRGRKIGYSKTCMEHKSCLGGETHTANSLKTLVSSIDSQKYEIVHLPKRLALEPLTIRCKSCGKCSDWMIINGRLGQLSSKLLCRHCELNKSTGENELLLYLQSIYSGEIIHGIRARKIIPPKELDIYLPELKLAFEYDGLYWHSEQSGKTRSYHLKKTEECEKQGIQLVHVFESEWENSRHIVESRIKNMIGLNDETVFARKCKVSNVSSSEASDFLQQNHIQGTCQASIRLGLVYNGSLVALMTFSKPRFQKNKYDYELARYCSKCGYHVPGAAGKLLKEFERQYHPKSILSYADRRWSTGKLYRALGFTCIGASKPNYWYFKSGTSQIINRVNCQKHRLATFLKDFNPELSEHQNMLDNGYDRIFDCGNLVFVKEYKDSNLI